MWSAAAAGGAAAPEERERPTGRGTADDPDLPQGRSPVEIPEDPHAEVWEATPLTRRAASQSGQRDSAGGASARGAALRQCERAAGFRACWMAARNWRSTPAVIDSPYGQGHVVLFSNNPFWRAETKGSYFLVFNAILNFDSLDAGRKLADK